MLGGHQREPFGRDIFQEKIHVIDFNIETIVCFPIQKNGPDFYGPNNWQMSNQRIDQQLKRFQGAKLFLRLSKVQQVIVSYYFLEPNKNRTSNVLKKSPTMEERACARCPTVERLMMSSFINLSIPFPPLWSVLG